MSAPLVAMLCIGMRCGGSASKPISSYGPLFPVEKRQSRKITMPRQSQGTRVPTYDHLSLGLLTSP
jgi:hypothetical protein